MARYRQIGLARNKKRFFENWKRTCLRLLKPSRNRKKEKLKRPGRREKGSRTNSGTRRKSSINTGNRCVKSIGHRSLRGSRTRAYLKIKGSSSSIRLWILLIRPWRMPRWSISPSNRFQNPLWSPSPTRTKISKSQKPPKHDSGSMSDLVTSGTRVLICASLFKSKRNAADASSSTSPESTFPPALLDRHSPTGFAELRACHFDPDPLGLYHSIFFEASMTWIADLYKKLEKRAGNVAKSITPLPEFCKSAINNQLAALKRSTKDQSWVILLIYRVPLHGKRRFLGLKKPTKAGQNTYGAYVVFMRKTRPEPSRANRQSGLSKPSDGTTYVNNGTDAGSNSDGGDARHSSTPPAPRPPPEDGDGAPWESPSNRKPAHQSQSRSRTHQRETDAVEFIERDRRPPPSYDRRGKEDGRLEREEIITTTRHYAHEPQDEYHSPPSAIIRDIGERDRSKFTSHYPPSSWKSSELERSDSRSDRIRSRSRARHGGHSDYFHMPDVAIREDRRSRPDGSFDRLERERLDLEKKYYNSGTNRNSRWARANSNIYDPYDYAPRSPVRAHWLDEDYGYDYGSSPIQSRKKHVYYDDDDEVYRPQSRVHRHRGNSTSTGAASGHRPTQERERIDIDIRSDEGERELPWSSSYDMEDDFRVVEDDRRPSRRQREDDPFEEEIIIRHRDTDSSDGTRGRSRGERSWHGSELSRDHYSNTPIDPNSWALVRTRPASKMSSYIERKATSGPPRTIRIQSPAKDKTRSNKSGTEDNIDVNIGTLIRRQRTGRPGKTENNEQRPFFTAETSQKNDASKPADSTPRPSITAEPESIPEPSPSPHNKSRDSYFQDDITPEDSISRRGSTPVVSSGDNNLVKEPEPKR